MPSKTDYSRKTKWKTEPYRGERGIGGNFVYSGANLLDKHLFVHRVSPGGFDWGPDASDAKASQLAIALLAPYKGVDYAVKHYHLFAENFVRRELSGDTWEIKRQDFRSKDYVTAIDGRDYPDNTSPEPDDVPDLEDVDLDSITYAEEIALAKKYEDVFWTHGNRRDNLRRLLDIWNGEVDPSSESVSSSTLYRINGLDIPSNARMTLQKEFDTMGDLAAWAVYGRNHSHLDGISQATADTIREAQAGFIQFFGGLEYIPDASGTDLTFAETPSRDEFQQTLATTTDESP